MFDYIPFPSQQVAQLHERYLMMIAKITVNLVYMKIKHSSINGASLLNDHINCIIVLLLLVELHHFTSNTANLKYFYSDILTELL